MPVLSFLVATVQTKNGRALPKYSQYLFDSAVRTPGVVYWQVANFAQLAN